MGDSEAFDPEPVAAVVGIALLLAGLGFGILAIGGALRSPDSALTSLSRQGGPQPHAHADQSLTAGRSEAWEAADPRDRLPPVVGLSRATHPCEQRS
jgi:hypothetical protein